MINPRRHRVREVPAGRELAPIVRLWMLRLMVPMNGHRRLIGVNGFKDDWLAAAMGLGKWVDRESDRFESRKARADLFELHRLAERHAHAMRIPRLLSRNLARLGELLELSAVDQQILAFAVMMQTEEVLEQAADLVGSFSSEKLNRALSTLLDLPLASVGRALEVDAKLTRCGLLSLERTGPGTFREKLTLLSDGFADRVTSSSADPIGFLRDTVIPSSAGHLGLCDFGHLARPMQVLVPYIRKSVETRRAGVNVLVHGSPGTGKSQFSKALALELGCSLYEVSGEDADGDPVAGEVRLRAYRAAQSVLARSRALILFEEVEDVFDSGQTGALFGPSPAKGRKAWINRALEGNPVPALWLSNSIASIDPAFLRRFDMVVELPVPPTRHREKIVREACAGILDARGVNRLVACEALAPAVVTRAASVVSFVADELSATQADDALHFLINQTLQAQGHAGLRSGAVQAWSDSYDPEFIHCDTDLAAVAKGIARTGSARICLYGPPGTGKTAWVHWLASQLGRPLLVRRASDLMSKWVGDTEKHIAAAFRRADAEGAILLIDEVDGFLQDRRNAKQNWEVTQVNELLTQMEGFQGIFVATTNLVEAIDEASLRRFDLKARFDFLRPAQAWELLVRLAVVLGLPQPGLDEQPRLNRLDQLAPGDFAAVARQHRFNPFGDSRELMGALEKEIALKCGRASRSIGFV